MNVRYAENGYGDFAETMSAERTAVLCDINTRRFVSAAAPHLGRHAVLEYPETELAADASALQRAAAFCRGYSYVLAVGAGTLNDIAKKIAFDMGVPSGVLATAPSMDGYASSVSALNLEGKKVTVSASAPRDVLLDRSILASAPPLMRAAGLGDILGKITALADWRLSERINGEAVHAQAAAMTRAALEACIARADEIASGDPDGLTVLTEALIATGKAISLCGNSRPASGSEHHTSHYLETEFLRRGERVPLHGVKVGMGTMLILDCYARAAAITDDPAVTDLCRKLPPPEFVKAMLEKAGCPVRYRDIGVDRALFADMVRNAYTVRDRYTILTYLHERGLTDRLTPYLEEAYW